MSAIARVQTQDREINQLQSNIITAVNPVIDNPIVNGTILTGVALATGSNVINHKLGRTLQGWILVRQRASASIYDTQDSNTTQDKNLFLTSSANVTVDIYVF